MHGAGTSPKALSVRPIGPFPGSAAGALSLHSRNGEGRFKATIGFKVISDHSVNAREANRRQARQTGCDREWSSGRHRVAWESSTIDFRFWHKADVTLAVGNVCFSAHCLCGSCAENLKFQSANCPICRVPFRALLQINALRHREIHHSDSDDNDNDDEYMYESISLIDALNLATTITQKNSFKQITTNDLYINRKPITTTDFKYFCSEHTV